MRKYTEETWQEEKPRKKQTHTVSTWKGRRRRLFCVSACRAFPKRRLAPAAKKFKLKSCQLKQPNEKSKEANQGPFLLLLPAFFSLLLFFSSSLLLFSSLRLPHLQSPYQPHCLSTIMDGVDQEVVNLENLPPITERLKDLRPSKVCTTHACTHIHAHSREHAHAHSHVHSITHTLTHSLNHIIQELLEFYRQKLAEFDAEHTSMLAKLDKYKHGCDDKVRACFFETTSLVVADNPCAHTHRHTHTHTSTHTSTSTHQQSGHTRSLRPRTHRHRLARGSC